MFTFLLCPVGYHGEGNQSCDDGYYGEYCSKYFRQIYLFIINIARNFTETSFKVTRKTRQFLIGKLEMVFFFKMFWMTSVLFVGPLMTRFWTSGDTCFGGFDSHRGSLVCILPH